MLQDKMFLPNVVLFMPDNAQTNIVDSHGQYGVRLF